MSSFTSHTDPRSYHVNTDKALRMLGYRAQRPIESAIDEVKDAFERGLIQDADSRCYNIRHMKHLLQTSPAAVFHDGSARAPLS